jgi:hypothetical protein
VLGDFGSVRAIPHSQTAEARQTAATLSHQVTQCSYLPHIFCVIYSYHKTSTHTYEKLFCLPADLSICTSRNDAALNTQQSQNIFQTIFTS